MINKNKSRYNQKLIQTDKFTEPFSLYLGVQTEGWDTVREVRLNKFKVKINKKNELILIDLEKENEEEMNFNCFYENNEKTIRTIIRTLLLSSIGAHCTINEVEKKGG